MNLIQAKLNSWIKSGRNRLLFKITLQLHVLNQFSSHKALQYGQVVSLDYFWKSHISMFVLDVFLFQLTDILTYNLVFYLISSQLEDLHHLSVIIYFPVILLQTCMTSFDLQNTKEDILKSKTKVQTTLDSIHFLHLFSLLFHHKKPHGLRTTQEENIMAEIIIFLFLLLVYSDYSPDQFLNKFKSTAQTSQTIHLKVVF